MVSVVDIQRRPSPGALGQIRQTSRGPQLETFRSAPVQPMALRGLVVTAILLFVRVLARGIDRIVPKVIAHRA